MGFFSWECPVCNKSIRSHWATDDKKMQECVVLWDDGTYSQGFYDGYGRLKDKNDNLIVDMSERQPARFGEEDFDLDREHKMYHKSCWSQVGCPDFNHGRWSRYADDQGFFLEEGE